MRVLYVSPFPPARDGIGTYTTALAGAVSGSVQFAVAAFGTRTVALLRWLDLLRRDVPAPVVITMHEVTRDTALLRGAGRALYRAMARRCDRVIVHTDAAFDSLTAGVGVPAAKVAVIPHPLARPPAAGSTPDELRARFGLGDALVLLAFGFIHVDKGLDDLVRALGILARSPGAPLDGVRLVVAGAVRRRQGLFRAMEARDRVHLLRVQRQARRSGLGPTLLFTGYVPERDVAGWFRAAEAAVLPYRRIEQSGVASMARAYGAPVIASTAGGLGEQFAGSPWMFPPRDAERLARILADFLGARPDQLTVESPEQNAADIATVAATTVDVYRTAGAASIGSVLHAG